MTPLATLKALVEAMTAGPSRAGRADMQSYDAGTGAAFTYLYADDLSERLPFVLGKIYDETGRNKADAAGLVALRNAAEALIAVAEAAERLGSDMAAARLWGWLNVSQPVRDDFQSLADALAALDVALGGTR